MFAEIPPNEADPSTVLKPVQGRIEGAVLDLQNVPLLKASVVVSMSLGGRASLFRGNIGLSDSRG